MKKTPKLLVKISSKIHPILGKKDKTYGGNLLFDDGQGPIILKPQHSSGKVRHNFKDSLFTDLFAHCEDAKKNFISLYKAVLDEPIEIDEGYLVEYLKQRLTEVQNMLIAEYCYEDDVRVQKATSHRKGHEEGLQEGLAQGRQEATEKSAINLLNLGKLSLQEIADCCSLSLQKVQELAESLKN